MRIKFIKEYRAIPLSGGIDNDWGCYKNEVKDVHDDQGQWLIDNGFAEKVKESSWWKPKYDEEYFYVGHDSYVHPCIWKNDPIDNGRLKLGLVFKTEEAGIRCCDYLKAIATVCQDEGVVTPEQTARFNNGYYIGVRTIGQLEVLSFDERWCCRAVNVILFDTVGNARASLDNHPDEWKIIANYDWSRE